MSSPRFAENPSGVSDILAAAPSKGGDALNLAFGRLMLSLGCSTGDVCGFASLAGGFKALGLAGGMIGKFAPSLLDFVQERGDDGVAGLLENAFSGG